MITVFYVVGGNKSHYDNLFRSIRSLKEHNFAGKILVLEIGNTLSSTSDFRVINDPNIIPKDIKGKTGFLFWKQKYRCALEIDTEYGVYFDTDTVLVNNNLDELINKIGDKIGVCQHFWVPEIKTFEQNSVPVQNTPEYSIIKNKLNLKDNYKFFTGGAFIFKNTPSNQNIFKEVLEIYNEVYNSSEYIKGITDELFFTGALYKHNLHYTLNGALNHCCMGNNFMPLKLENNILYGRNTFETDWEMVTILHCDPARRNPAIHYSDEINRKIKDCFYL